MLWSSLNASTGLATRGLARPTSGRAFRYETVCRSGFGSENEKRSSSSAKKKGRRKAPKGPSPKEQLKRLQEDEKKYREEMERKYATSVSDAPEEDDSDAVVPEQITDRMLRRILLFSGGPLLLGMLLFPLFYYIKKVQGIDLPVWAVYIVQTGVFGGALVGISYGIVSASFDPTREGSLLGWNEFQANLPQVLDSFRRKKN
mmetsp:Transcript_10463/g.20674  ORF Transcript_10463/g.20674 Transcript_10463/m.20674 type:complete len:202 (-) Transcript_10463:558-1163(-)